MNRRLWIGVAAGVLVLALVLGIGYALINFTFMGGRFYPKGEPVLDLRDQKLTVEQYNKLHVRLPYTRIHWNVPFQGITYPDDVQEMTLTELSMEDIELLGYFPELEVIHAVDFQDVSALLKAELRWRNITWDYESTLGGQPVDRDVRDLVLESLAPEELKWLESLRRLESVTVTGTYCDSYADLREYCRERNIPFTILLGGEKLTEDAAELTLENATDGEISLLRLLTGLKKLHLVNPTAQAETVVSLPETYPDAQITWEVDFFGMVFDQTATEVDLTGLKIEDLELVERRMAYLPQAEKLIIEDLSLDNELLAAYRERARADYKVVWTVWCGNQKTKWGTTFTCRTDATTFMPLREGLYYFIDDEAINLKYCEDIIAMDIGHMRIRDISFVRYMPNLKYLILAHTDVRDITPLESCKNLVFLELDHSGAPDFTPLLGCTSLEDLNIGETFPSIEPILKMTWLKNLWCIKRGNAAVYRLMTEMPETVHVQGSGAYTVAEGWRKLPNYYAMRDLLGMPYMD